MKALLIKIRQILRDRRTRQFLTRFVSVTAAIVVFVTTYALVLPAITMESQAACGIEAHQHDDSCYTENLICGQEESEGHHHTEDCYTVTRELVCSFEEHQHSAENGCYDEDGNPICTLEEHTHTDSCYEEHRELTCGLEESEGHHHTDSCYEKVLTCGKEVHIHSAECYRENQEVQSAAVASTGMTSAAAVSDFSEEEQGQEESLDGDISNQSLAGSEEINEEDENTDESVDATDKNADEGIGEDRSETETKETETEDNEAADIDDEKTADFEEEKADDDSVAAEADALNKESEKKTADESEDVNLKGDEDTSEDESADAFKTDGKASEESDDKENLNIEDSENTDKEGEESASSFTTGFAAEEDEDSYIPEKEALDFNTVLNNRTGIYYYHLSKDEIVEDSSAITNWTRVDEDTELGSEDLIRVYLSYTLPADTINATNDIARYRLPDTLHLTDEQIDAINKCENGISSQYVDYSKLEITDIERHAAYLGLESVEGTRTPDEELKEDSEEYISAIVKAEKIYDEDDRYEGTDLIFTFSPYTVGKNAHAYDKDGQPTRAGEKVGGWLMLDFNLGQVDFEDPVITRTAFERSDAESADGFNEDNDHIEYDPAEDDSVEEKHNTDNSTVETEDTEDTEDNTDGGSGKEADNGQNPPAAIERSERTAEVVFVEDGWDEKGDQINKISTTLRVVEETVIEAENEDALEDSAADNTAETTAEDTGEAATEDAASAVTEDSASAAAEETADPSDNGTTAEEAAKDPVDADQVIMPAMSFNDSIKISTGRPAGIDKDAEGTLAEAAESLPEEAEVSVRVEADEGTFPAGTTMVLSAVDQSSIDTLAETLAETVESGNPSAADTSGSDADDRKDISDHTEDKETNQSESKNNSNTRTYGFQAVDITFLDKDGNEIEPAKPVRVALTSAAVEQAREKVEDSPIADPVVVHVDNEGNAEQMDLVNPEEVEPAKGRSEEELLEEAEKATESDKADKAETDVDANTADTETPADEADDENDDADAGSESVDVATTTGMDNNDTDSADEVASTVNEAADETEESAAAEGTFEADEAAVEEDGENEGTAEFTTDSFSVYAIVYTVELYTNVITDSGETYRITVTYDETSGIPQDAELNVKEIKEGDKGYEDYYTEAVKAASESSDAQNNTSNNASDKDNKRINPDKTYARFFDIEIQANGQKVEPAGDVSVSIRLLDVPETDDRNVIKIVHFDQDDIEIIPHTAAADHTGGVDTAKDRDDKQAENHAHSEMEFNFTARSFSVYSVVSYTVDFHWEVDGEEYTFSIIGGSAIAFSDLLSIIGVVKDDPETEVNEVKEFFENVQSVSFSNPELLSVSKVENNTTVGEIKDRLNLECEYSPVLTEEQIDEINTTKLQAGDWALISLKSFNTEEWLTVNLKDNQTFRIRVTDPVSDTAPGSMQTLTTEDTRSDGIKMWLFDYDNDHNLDNKNNTATATSSTYYTDGINSYSDFKFLGWGASNQDETNRDCLNDFTGLDNAGGSNDIRALQGIVKNTLVNGYPVLNDNHKTNGVNQSLAYLFDPTLSTSDRTVYGGTSKDDGNVTKLFRKDSNGYYIYDSDEHYAELQSDNKTFKVYTSTLGQTDKNGNNHNPKRAVGFFPFDSYENAYYTKYGNNYNWGNNGYGSLYLNPDGGPYSSERVGLNHHLGVAMEMNFEIPEGGKIGDTPIQFNFSGDDDMWVFIDDQLVLDIGGLHQPVDGTIDFSTGKATITGKATQAGHTDNTGDAAIVTVEGANDPRGNNFSFYPALGLTGGDGKIHTMKIFYLERGGCDSNCMISFNLPLVVLKKNSELTKVKEDSSPLAGAEFTVFEDRACTIPLTIAGKPVKAVSGSDGSVVINDIPYKKEELNTKVYYMKETSIPNEYADNTDVYILHYNAAQDRVNIKRLNADGTEETLPNSRIINKKMSLVVKKEWLNEDGSEMNPKPTTPVTFTIKRYKTYVPKPDTSNMQTITLKYQKYGQYNSRGETQCQVNARPGDVVTVTISDTDTNWSSTSNGNNNPQARFNVVGGAASFDIQMIAGRTTWQLESHNYNRTATNTASISAVNKTYEAEQQQEPVTVIDPSFNRTLTLPTTPDGAWIDTVSNLPAQELKSDGIRYYYQYYAEEAIPEGYKVIYYDKDGNEIQDPSSLKTDVPGTVQTIGNKKYPHTDIPVEKFWKDFIGDEYDWQAKLQMDYREIPLEGGEPSEWTEYRPGDSRYCKTISKAHPNDVFADMPMYVMDNDRKEYRREYSVVEIAYTVWKNGQIIARYDRDLGINPPDDHKFTLWFEHDAGEDDNYDDNIYPDEEDYNIVVHNMLEHRNIEKKANIDVQKIWENNSHSSDPNANAKFRLKRYVTIEYRNYENLTNINWVEISLNTGTGQVQTIRVPQGNTIYIRGYLKGNAEGDIRFTSTAGASPDTYHAENDSSERIPFTIYVTADQTKTLTLNDQSNTIANIVVGGKDGFRLSESNSVQSAIIDPGFCIEFDLNEGNNWQKHFPEPDPSHEAGHDYNSDLPVIEYSVLDDAGLTANTYVYRYFIEEVECTPESFNATFTDGSGQELLGDEDHQFFFDATIKATNRPTGLDVLKVDKKRTYRVLPGAEFQLRKLEGDPPVPATIGGAYSGTIVPPDSTSTDSEGKQTFKPDEGLTPGYYELTELKAPDGYVLTTDPTIYIKVDKLGVIQLLKRNASGAVLWDEAAEEGELVGNASISTSTSAADGKTITFTVRNESGVELPSTGGSGTRFIYILGGILTAAAIMLLGIKRLKV